MRTSSPQPELLASCQSPPPAANHPPPSVAAQVMGLIDNELSEPYSIFTYRWIMWPAVTPGGMAAACHACPAEQCVIAPLPRLAAPLPCRYFLHNWPHLCFLVFKGDRCFGTVVAKMDVHRDKALRGYIAMLTVQQEFRYLGVGEREAGRAGARPVLGMGMGTAEAGAGGVVSRACGCAGRCARCVHAPVGRQPLLSLVPDAASPLLRRQ